MANQTNPRNRRLPALLLLVVAAVPSFAQEPLTAGSLADPEQSAAKLMEPALPAIEKGLQFLASQQVANGAFSTREFESNVAVGGLCGLAFLSSGSTPDRGPYGGELTKIVEFLLANTADSGLVHIVQRGSQGPMYGHGFATLFLAEVYGMSPKEALRKKLSKAVELIVSTQNQEGGWRYQPVRDDADLSVTICQVMALRAARNAGIHVPNETIDRCIDYVKRCQNADGGFRYMLSSSESRFPRSAAGVVALYSAGIYEGIEIERGLKYLETFQPPNRLPGADQHFSYAHYYAVQAMWHAGGEPWHQWYPAIRDLLLTKQLADGSWRDKVGPQYATAMACIILQIPNNVVPIFQR